MQIQIVSSTSIKRYNNNPRYNDSAVQAVADSIQEFGFKNPILVDKNNTIIAGDTRYRAATEILELDKIPVIICDDLTDEQVAALRIADNKTGELSEWNEEALAEEIKYLQSVGYNIDLTGFSFDEIEELLKSSYVDNIKEDEDFNIVNELEDIATPKSENGDIWYLGNHKLMCGDSRCSDDLEKLMANDKAQLIITDPPYNVDYQGVAGKIKNDNMSPQEFKTFLCDTFANANKHSAPGASFYVFYADKETENFRISLRENNFEIKQNLIWIKNTFVLGRQDYQWKHEPILYGWKADASHYFINNRSKSTIIDTELDFRKMSKAALIEYIETLLSDIKETTIYCDKPVKSEDHPTMKPIKLIADFLINSSKAKWIVLDMFGGSGSTLIACEQTGRHCRMMECDPKYVDVIVKRYVNLTGDEECYCVKTSGKKIKYKELYN